MTISSRVDIFQDNTCHGEDAYLVRDLGPGTAMDCVFDGVTHCEGAYASGFTKDLLARGAIGSLDDASALLQQANEVLFRSGRGRKLLTTVALALYRQERASILSVGDSVVFLARDGAIATLTPPLETEELPNALTGGAIGLKGEWEYASRTLDLHQGDKVVTATDGLVKNLSEAEVCAVLEESRSPTEAVEGIRAKIAEKRQMRKGRDDSYGGFKEDDMTAVVRFIL